MIDDIKQIMVDCFSVRLPDNQLYEAAKEIDELVRARTLPVYLRLCTVDWSLRLAMNNLAGLREEPVAQENLKRYCEVCEEETEWEFIGYQRDGLGFNLFALHNCVKCGTSRNLKEKG